MEKSRKNIVILSALAIVPVLLFAANIFIGSVRIPFSETFGILLGHGSERTGWTHIVLDTRLPQAFTALLSGAALAASGLMLQTLFRNPLAGPSILGVSDGANLGVAISMLYLGTSSYLGTIFAAFIGAGAVLAIILAFSRKVRSNVMLLIIGIMVGYLASSVISILNFQASADKVRQFVMWGMGDFASVSAEKLPWFAGTALIGVVGALLLIKPLNALLLGEAYASNLGLKTSRTRLAIFIVTGLLTGCVTAFCGPISFIGLAVPHIARLLLGSSDHKRLMPATIICGASMALACNLIATVGSGSSPLPLNAVSALLGAPVIIYVIMNRRNIQYFD